MSSLPHPTHGRRFDRPLTDFGRRPLGALLLERGLITRPRLDAALDECARTGRRIGEVLADRGWIFENELAHALAEQNGLRYVDIAATSVDPAAAQLLPRDFAEQFVAVPVRVLSSDAVLVAVADPGAIDVDVLRIAVGREVELVVGDLSAIRNAWRHCS
jgi:type IV pilus assembly protein PilB